MYSRVKGIRPMNSSASKFPIQNYGNFRVDRICIFFLLDFSLWKVSRAPDIKKKKKQNNVFRFIKTFCSFLLQFSRGLRSRGTAARIDRGKFIRLKVFF